MAQTNILCPVTVPASFSLIEGDPMFYTELTNWIIGLNIEAMAAAGLQWSDGVPDDLESAWSIQSSMLSQQSSILTSIDTQALSTGWQARITGLQSMIINLNNLTQNSENYRVRATMIAQIENSIQTLTLSPTETGIMTVQLTRSTFPSEQPPELVPLWNAQTNVILEQNERLDLIYTDLENKRENLENYTFDWGEVILSALGETIFEWIGRTLLKWKDEAIPAPIQFLIDWALNLIPNAIAYLIEKYRQARSEIGAIKAENEKLLELSITWENYSLRTAVLVHHEKAIENLLKEIVEHEKPLDQLTGGDMAELIQAVKDLQYNGQEFVYKDGSSYVLHGKTLVGTD
jgi:hypothetical protein